MSDGVKLRLIRRRGDKIVRRWDADIPLDDPEALAVEYLTAVRAHTRCLSDKEAKVFTSDYRLEWFARVGGWTRFQGRP